MSAPLKGAGRRHKELIEHLGAKVVDWRFTGSNHLRFLVALPDGSTRPIFSANTPSDWRAERNLAAMVKRVLAMPAANDPVYASKS